MTYTFSTFSDPAAGSAAAGFEGTTTGAINSGGQVAGSYFDSSGETHGFLYNPIGSAFTTLDYPTNSIVGLLYTSATGINDGGEVVGTYEDGLDETHGFLYNPNNPVGSQWTTLDYGDTPPTQNGATYAEGINNAGEIVGYYTDSGGTDHAFLYNPNGATLWTTLDDPQASQNFGQGTYAEGINNSGEIVGYYTDSGGTDHAFLYNPNGATLWTNFDTPEVSSGDLSIAGLGTFAYGINDAGQIVGAYDDGDGTGFHGFVDTNGNFVTLDGPTPSGSTNHNTFATGINNGGQVVGYTNDTVNNFQNTLDIGFIAQPSASNALQAQFGGQLIEGTSATLTVSLTVAQATDTTIDLTVTPGTEPGQDIQDIPASVDIKAGQTKVTVPFQLEQDPFDTAPDETFTVAATSPVGDATVSATVKDFDSKPYAFVVDGGEFHYNSVTSKMNGSGAIDLDLVSSGGTSTLLTIEGATATYDNSQFVASGTVVEDLTGDDFELFKGGFTLPYAGISTSQLSDSGPFAGKIDLGGLPVSITQLTLESGTVLAAFDLSLPFTLNSITIDTTKISPNFALQFDDTGASIVGGGSVTFPDSGPVDVFGIFTGSVSSASISYTAATDTLKLQGKFEASKILGFNASATVDLSGNNFIQYQNGKTDFVGSATITEEVAPTEPFAFQEIDLAADTIQKTFSGEVKFVFPFGGQAPQGDVKLVGSWASGPTITEVDVGFSNFSIPIPNTPDFVWTSAAVGIKNMFVNNAPVTFSGSLGFAFGPQLNGNYIANVTFSGSGSTQQLSAGYDLSLVTYDLASSLPVDLSEFKPLFPLIHSTGTVTASFANGGFQDLKFAGTTNIFGDFITTSAQIQANNYLDFTAAGVATVDFGNEVFAKYISNGPKVQASFLASFTDAGPLSGDYAEAWFTDTETIAGVNVTFTLGAKVNLDGEVSVLFSAPDASQNGARAGSQAARSQEDESQEASYLFLTDTWTNSATAPVTLTLTSAGTAIAEADFASYGIAVVSALSTPFTETIVIQNPTSGTVWTVSASDGVDDLGTQTLTSAIPDVAPSITSFSAGSVNSDGTLTVDYTVANAGSATISFLADRDGANFDGVLLSGQSFSGVALSGLTNGSGTANVSLAGLNGGFWRVYAMISDGVSIPQEIYASAGVLINAGGSGAEIFTPIVVGGGHTLTISKGQSSAGIEVQSGGLLKVLNGGSAVAAAVYSGGSEWISAGGVDAGAQVLSGGLQVVRGTAIGATIDGTLSAAVGGSVSGAVIDGAGVLVDYGKAAGGVVGGEEQVKAGGSDSGALLVAGAAQFVSGTAIGTTIDSGAESDVEKTGVAISAAINGGTERVFGKTNSATVAGGTLIVEAGGNSNDAAIGGGGTLAVLSAGAAAATAIFSGGTEIVSAHGTDTGAVISGGIQLDYGVATGDTVFAGVLVVESGGKAASTKVSSGGTLELLSGGAAVGTQLLSGGTLLVGGILSDFHVGSGAALEVSGGVIADTLVLPGGSVELLSGATQSSTTIDTGGALLIGPGATLSGFKVGAGVTLAVISGGVGSDAVVKAGGLLEVFPGAIVAATISAGGALELVGGNPNASAVILDSGALIDYGSGFAGSGNISAANPVNVLAGGLQSGGAVLSGASLNILSGGLGSNVSVSADGKTIVFAGGTEFGVAAIGSGGLLAAGSGGTVVVNAALTNSGTLIASGAGSLVDVLNGAVVNGGAVTVGAGVVHVHTGASANVAFLSTATGALVIDDSAGNASAFAGNVIGFGGGGHSNHTAYIDLADVTSAAGLIKLGYTSASSHTSGTLTVSSSGVLVASIELIGQYSSANFHLGKDASGHVKITDPGPSIAGGVITTLATTGYGAPATSGAASVALLGNYMAALFAAPEGQIGAQTATAETAQSQAALAHPHAA